MQGYNDKDIGQDTGACLKTAGRSEIVAQACRSIENHESTPNLDELAAEAGLSRWQLHRLFVAETGLTPKAYAAAVRADRLRNTLATGDMPVTDAIYDAGFNASSRFYETADRVLGMRARDYRAGGSGTDIHFAVGQCTLGAILVAESQRGICAILLGDDPDALVQDLQKRFPNASLTGDDADFAQRVARVVGLVETPRLGVDLPLDIRGTAFQERVWQALRTIPPGSTISYAELAERIGSPAAVRAVANACGANWLAVAIPCHRVVRRNGDPSGYRWGVERKQALLKRERHSEAGSVS
ncbi:MAG: bifunctional DNA-binding transcriptional regulator/O6-methylguanine-DNA methyltransferase Ada [Burkholderiaceae bacterium]